MGRWLNFKAKFRAFQLSLSWWFCPWSHSVTSERSFYVSAWNFPLELSLRLQCVQLSSKNTQGTRFFDLAVLKSLCHRLLFLGWGLAALGSFFLEPAPLKWVPTYQWTISPGRRDIARSSRAFLYCSRGGLATLPKTDIMLHHESWLHNFEVHRPWAAFCIVYLSYISVVHTLVGPVYMWIAVFEAGAGGAY